MRLIKKRLSAFFLDMFLVIFLSICLSGLAYLNPYKDKYESNVEKYDQVYGEFSSSLLDSSSSSYINSTEVNEYMIDNIIPIIKKVNHYNIFYSLWYLVIYFLYFVIFAYFNNGQTLGKKIFKIRVVDKFENKPSILNLTIRSLFNGSRLYLGLNLMIIINMLLPLITDMRTYYYIYISINFLAFVFELSLIIVFLIKKGIISTHDILAKTKVIEDK